MSSAARAGASSRQAALAENQRYQLAAAYLILTGNAVTEAITIASTRFQIATVEDLIKNDQKNLDLVQRAFDAGKVAQTDVLTAEAQLESDRTQLPPLHQQLSAARHALAVLVGEPPGGWTPPEFDIDAFTLPGELPVSLPSELVRQRPDILASEALLHADSAAIGVATAQMYPSITLSASLGPDGLDAREPVRGGEPDRGPSAPSVDAPIFHGGALRRSSGPRSTPTTRGSRRTSRPILQAFGQVADSLHRRSSTTASWSRRRSRAVDIAKPVARAAALELRGRAGPSALQLIVAENTYSNARLGYVARRRPAPRRHGAALRRRRRRLVERGRRGGAERGAERRIALRSGRGPMCPAPACVRVGAALAAARSIQSNPPFNG